jgi:SAM-dependent methyltransferase
MITTSKHTALANNLPATYAVADCSALLTSPTSEATKWETAHKGKYSKVFSNAALHWILKNPDNRVQTFQAAYDALEPGGTLVFEMGGQGNVAELRGTILLSVARMIGIEAARAADPWFFPDEPWMAKTLGDLGFAIEKMEIEARPTAAEEGPGGGLDGWLRLMAKDWLDVLPNETDKEVCVAEVKEALETVCGTASGQPRYILNYKRLRVKARKPE